MHKGRDELEGVVHLFKLLKVQAAAWRPAKADPISAHMRQLMYSDVRLGSDRDVPSCEFHKLIPVDMSSDTEYPAFLEVLARMLVSRPCHIDRDCRVTEGLPEPSSDRHLPRAR